MLHPVYLYLLRGGRYQPRTCGNIFRWFHKTPNLHEWELVSGTFLFWFPYSWYQKWERPTSPRPAPSSLRTLSRAPCQPLSEDRHTGSTGAAQTRPSQSELNGEQGCWTLDFTQPSTSLRQLKRKQNSNTVYSKQYLKSIGLRSSSIYYYTFFSLVPGEGRPTSTHIQKLLTIWAQRICLSGNDCGIPSSLPSLSAMDPWMWKWIASCESTCLTLCLLIPNAIDGQISILGPRGKICG